jgi:C4-dicarboxylate-specific signal transduction histidine kinase
MQTKMWNSSESSLVSERQNLSSALDAARSSLQDKAVELERTSGKFSEAQKNLAKEAERREKLEKEKDEVVAALQEKSQMLSQLQHKSKDQVSVLLYVRHGVYVE